MVEPKWQLLCKLLFFPKSIGTGKILNVWNPRDPLTHFSHHLSLWLNSWDSYWDHEALWVQNIKAPRSPPSPYLSPHQNTGPWPCSGWGNRMGLWGLKTRDVILRPSPSSIKYSSVAGSLSLPPPLTDNQCSKKPRINVSGSWKYSNIKSNVVISIYLHTTAVMTSLGRSFLLGIPYLRPACMSLPCMDTSSSGLSLSQP